MQIKSSKCTVIEVASVMEYNMFGLILFFTAAVIKTPNGNTQKRGILFLTAEEANAVKAGDKIVM